MRVLRAVFLCEPCTKVGGGYWERVESCHQREGVKDATYKRETEGPSHRAFRKGTGLPIYHSSQRTGKEKGAELPNHVPDLYEHLGIISHSTKAWGKVSPLLSHP